MGRWSFKFLLALALIVGSTGGVASFVAASNHQISEFQVVSKLYFPYVPHAGMIGDTGNWHSGIVLQNLEEKPLVVWILPDGRFNPDNALATFTLDSRASSVITPDELGMESPGSSLVIAAIDHTVWQLRNNPSGLENLAGIGGLNPPRIAATLKTAVGPPMGDGVWTSDEHDIVDGYAAIPMNDVGWGDLAINCPTMNLNNCAVVSDLSAVDGISYLPLAQTNNQWNTILYVTNVEGSIDDSSLVKVELLPNGDGVNDQSWSEEMRLTPGETWAIDVLNEVGAEWIGSVRISSDAGTAAVAARHKSETDMMLMNTSAPSRTDDGTGFRLSAPLVYVDYFGWNTGFSIANQSDNGNIVVVRFYDTEGNEVGETVKVVDPHGHGVIYLPSEVEEDVGEGWIGSAVLESDNGQPFHAAVDQVNYSNGSAMSYALAADGADLSPRHEKLALPLLQKNQSLGSPGDTSGIQLFNPDPENDVQAQIRLYTLTGAAIPLSIDGHVDIDLGPRSGHTFYVLNESEIPLGTVGSVIVTVSNGDGQILAVSNVANYEVQGDGAAVFSLSNGTGQFR